MEDKYANGVNSGKRKSFFPSLPFDKLRMTVWGKDCSEKLIRMFQPGKSVCMVQPDRRFCRPQKRQYIFSLVILLNILLLSSNISLAQNQHKLDSLFKQLNEKNMDTIQMKVNRKIARIYMDNNQNKALEYFEKAKDIAVKLDRKLETGDNYYSIGYCYLSKGDIDKSLENYLQSVTYYEQVAYDPSVVDAYLSIISVYSELKNFRKSKEYMEVAEKLLTGRKDSFQLANLYNQSGTVYSKQGLQDSALFYMKKGLAIAKASNDKLSMIISFSNLSLAFKKDGQYAEALKYCDSALQLILQREDNFNNLAVVYNNMGAVHTQIGNYAKSVDFFSKSIRFAKEAGILSVEMENYRNMSDLYEKMGDYKQHSFYLKKYGLLKDSMFTNESKNQIAQLETDYIVGKKNNELIKKDASIQQQKNQRNILVLIALASLMMLGGAVYFNRTIQHKRKLLQEQNVTINHQKNELQNLNQVKDRLFSVISHDLRNPLNTLQSYLMLSDNESITADKRLLFKNQTIQAVAQTGNMLDNLLTWANMQIRDTTPKIIPLEIKHIVADVVDVLQPQDLQKQIQIQQEIDDIRIIGDADILSIAIRNIVTNAIKFSREHQVVYITGHTKGDHFLLTIRDEGIGISKEQIEQIQNYKNTNSEEGTKGEQGTGLGLFLVKQLLNKINVPLVIESEEGEGSSFTLHVLM